MNQNLAAGLLLALAPSLAPAQAAAKPARPWTLLVYGGADNNADGPILEFLDDVRKAIDDDPGIELLLLLDRNEKFSDDATMLGSNFTGAQLFRLRKDSAERLSGAPEMPELTLSDDAELDTADADNVRRFIEWGKAHYPAQHYGVMIYSHANGSTMCPDEESGRDMGIPELSEVLRAKHSVDFLALELCNMGGIEISYQWRPESDRFGADVLVAIPNAGPPLDWDRAFARIRSKGHEASPLKPPFLDPATMTAADFGKLVMEEGQRGRELAAAAAEKTTFSVILEGAGDKKIQVIKEVRAITGLGLKEAKDLVDGAPKAIKEGVTKEEAADIKAKVEAAGGKVKVDSAKERPDRVAHEAAGCYDLRKAKDVKLAVDALAVALAASPDARGFFMEMRGPGPIGDAMCYDEGGPFIDLYSLCQRVAECDALSDDVRARSRAVLKSLEGFVLASFGMSGYPGFESGRHGVFIILPVDEPGRWKNFKWYTPLVHQENGKEFGRWAFLADGATAGNGKVENWFELLDSWFDAADDSGGVNNYSL